MLGMEKLITRTEDGFYRLPATLSFLALPVIPAIKLTDRGLFVL